ncbi:MAG: HK97 family phage prohead protease [Acidimicrobiales bacterium]
MNPAAERAELHHVTETREMPFTDAECRMEAGTGNGFRFRGYASIFESPYPIEDAYGEYIETARRGCFDRSLAQGCDTVFLINHAGAPLARTKSGTLALSADNRGLLAEAKLDPANPRAQELKSMVERGDLSQMSFSFRDLAPCWNDSFTERSLKSVELNHGDVACVSFAANPATEGTLAMRSRIASARAQLSTAEINDLPDSDFAYIESGGSKDYTGRTVPRSKRHFPIHDPAHVRDALARIGQGAKFGKVALPNVLAAAKKFGITVSQQNSLIAKGETRSPLHGFTSGSHTHSHPANGSQGSWKSHTHTHSHDGDASHEHSHDPGALIADADASQEPNLPSETLSGLPDYSLEARLAILKHMRRMAETAPLTRAEQMARTDQIVARRRAQRAQIQGGNKR